VKKLEIACCNIESVINAIKGGASRIELFENLADGGCTPSYGMMKKAKEYSNIPVYAMIRPRGGDFCYTRAELEIMREDIKVCLDLNLDGIVLGVLTKGNEVDQDACRSLLDAWKNKSATFHRAVDATSNIENAVNTIIQLGFERILTSGGKPKADQGIEVILELHKKYGKQISIMAGSGITAANVHLFSELNEVHATCKIETKSDNLFGNYSNSDLDTIVKLKQSFT
jgi:copper homeostasis protein